MVRPGSAAHLTDNHPRDNHRPELDCAGGPAAGGRGEQAQLLVTSSLPSGDQIDARVSTCIDVLDFVGHKIRAAAAHRSQYPIDPRTFADPILREMFGVEYFIRVLPERELHTSLLDD